MTMPEKMNEKTTSMPTQNTPVAQADGSSLLQETLPASKSHIVSHQKARERRHVGDSGQRRPANVTQPGPTPVAQDSTTE